MNAGDEGNELERPCSRLARLKVHLRLLRLAGKTYRVVTLRPGTPAAFSTNYFHDTWHIVTDQVGSRLLARLVWGLAFQRHPLTLLLVHGPHLLPTPFEGERSDLFVIIPAHLTPVDGDAFGQLKAQLGRLGSPDCTVRWQTFGLDLALNAEGPDSRHVSLKTDPVEWKDAEHLWSQELMGRCGGLIYYSAPPAILRWQALRIHRLSVRPGDYVNEMDYHFLAEGRAGRWHFPDGEVQIFSGYRDRVASAVEARHESVPNPNQAVIDEDTQELISRRRDAIIRRRKWCRQRKRVSG